MTSYVLGLGHVGLPLACWLALSGQVVLGVDIDCERIAQIRAGRIDIEEYRNGVPIKEIAKTLIERGGLQIGEKIERVGAEPAVFLISVGIADRPDGSKDLSPVIGAVEAIADVLEPHDLIVLRSTMIPGTCETTILPILQRRNLPFHFAYCPETIIETQAFEELEQNPLILSGMDEESLQKALAFFRTVTQVPIHTASNIRTAEMAKVVQNICRDVNIAFANEISDAAVSLKIDDAELQRLVNVNPRVSMLTSGPGVGGYCLPNALSYLRGAMPDDGLTLSQTARKLNQERPHQLAQRIIQALGKVGKSVQGAKIAVAGLAMKSYCADLRNSPALDLIRELEDIGAQVRAYDPLVPPQFPFQAASLADAVQDADCLVITALQRAMPLDTAALAAHMAAPPIIMDTQHVLKPTSGVALFQ